MEAAVVFLVAALLAPVLWLIGAVQRRRARR